MSSPTSYGVLTLVVCPPRSPGAHNEYPLATNHALDLSISLCDSLVGIAVQMRQLFFRCVRAVEVTHSCGFCVCHSQLRHISRLARRRGPCVWQVHLLISLLYIQPDPFLLTIHLRRCNTPPQRAASPSSDNENRALPICVPCVCFVGSSSTTPCWLGLLKLSPSPPWPSPL